MQNHNALAFGTPWDSSDRARGTCRRGKGRVIDHIVAWPGEGGRPPPHSLRVGYLWDTSDHFPIFATVLYDFEFNIPITDTPCFQRLASRKIPVPSEDDDESEWLEMFKKFVNANRFELFANVDSEDAPIPTAQEVDSQANSFVDAVCEAARDVTAVVEHNKRRIPRPSLQRSILRAIDQRRRAFTSYSEAQGGAVH